MEKSELLHVSEDSTDAKNTWDLFAEGSAELATNTVNFTRMLR
jgi:hypothetical protein